jgi:hypothetical protein
MHELAYKADCMAYIGLRIYKINKLPYHPLINLQLVKKFNIHGHLLFVIQMNTDKLVIGEEVQHPSLQLSISASYNKSRMYFFG